MKPFRLIFIFLLTFLMSESVVAQYAMVNTKSNPSNESVKKKENAPPKIIQEAEVVYVDESSRTYVNKNLPIYLKFSTTPDGKTYDLKSQRHPEDSAPIYLDTEGPNLIRTKWAVDPNSKEYVYPLREVEMELYADSKPPIVSPILTSSNKHRISNVTYYGSDLAIELKDWDEQSGVKQSLWSLNNDAWEEGKTEFANRTSGDYSYSYYSVDNVNNYTEAANINFVFDNTAPITNLIKTELDNYVFGPNTKVQFEVIEEHSGIRATYFKLGELSYIKVKEGQVLPSSLTDGDYVITYYSVDNVNNGEELKELNVYLDKIAPISTINATSSYTRDDILFVSANSLITLSSKDNKAGVKQINYTTRDAADELYENAFSLQNFHGLTSVKFSANDKVENVESENTQKVFVDTLKPSTSIEFLGDYFEVANRYYVNGETQLKLVGSDANAGVAFIEYAGIGNEFSKYDQPFSLKEEGYYGMMYRSVDNVNNVEYSKSIDLYLDKKGPEIVYNFSNRPIGVEEGIPVYPSGTRLFLGATDDQSGTNSISYKVNDQNEVHYSSPKTIDISEKKAFKKGQSYDVQITTTDLVNNESSEIIAFKIED